jgi:hypothetical protein
MAGREGIRHHNPAAIRLVCLCGDNGVELRCVVNRCGDRLHSEGRSGGFLFVPGSDVYEFCAVVFLMLILPIQVPDMTRDKGRPDYRTTGHNFPFVVEINVPEGGLGNRLNAMHEFHAKHGIKPVSRPGRRQGGRRVISWCFRDVATAEAFADVFDGVMMLNPDG